jgi:hypothetical protein
MRFSRLSFRMILVLLYVSFLEICASPRSKAGLSGATADSDGSVSAIPLQVSVVKKQVDPIPTWTFLRRQDASSAATITSKQFEP